MSLEYLPIITLMLVSGMHIERLGAVSYVVYVITGILIGIFFEKRKP